MARKNGLGKGLEALFEDNSSNLEKNNDKIKISEIHPNKTQPRKDFDQSALEQLADSIRQYGIIQPLILREDSTGGYQIVAGERRFRAARMAGLTEVPAVVRDFDDLQVMQIALIENLQREDLNPVEEAFGYKQLMSEFNFTQEQVAKSVGKSRPVVANALRILNLPEQVLDMLKKGEISSGHARALLAIEDENKLKMIAFLIVKNNLTVRDIEKMSKTTTKKDDKKSTFGADSYYEEMQLALENELGKKIKIVANKDKGKLIIDFYNKEELKAIAELLTK